jgi:hypothetical protein
LNCSFAHIRCKSRAESVFIALCTSVFFDRPTHLAHVNLCVFSSCIYRVEQRSCHASVLSAAATLRAAHRRARDQDSLKRRMSAKGRIGDRCRAAVARGSFVDGVCASRVQAWVRRSAARQVYIRTVHPTPRSAPSPPHSSERYILLPTLPIPTQIA